MKIQIEFSTSSEDELTAEDIASLEAESTEMEACQAACTQPHDLALLVEDGCEHCGFYAK